MDQFVILFDFVHDVIISSIIETKNKYFVLMILMNCEIALMEKAFLFHHYY